MNAFICVVDAGKSCIQVPRIVTEVTSIFLALILFIKNVKFLEQQIFIKNIFVLDYTFSGFFQSSRYSIEGETPHS